MRVKPWVCPECHQEFIVDGESTRDTCPWCQAVVEEGGEGLRVVVQEAAETFPPGEPPPEDEADEAEPAGATSGTQSWWPFEHNS